MDLRGALQRLASSLGDGLVSSRGEGLDAVAAVRPDAVRRALETLRRDCGFNVLVDLTCVDYMTYGRGSHHRSPAPGGARFKLVYRLMDLDPLTGLARQRLALEAWLAEGQEGPPTAMDLWPNADWLEREVWDMFGVKPSDRPGIKRLLMYEEFQGHPLRKDYPLRKRQPTIGAKEDPPVVRDRFGGLPVDMRVPTLADTAFDPGTGGAEPGAGGHP